MVSWSDISIKTAPFKTGFDSFEAARERLARHDKLVDHWRETIRPLCENHRQMGFWERNRHVWRGDDMCSLCRGKYTQAGYPPYRGNMLSDVMSVEYGPAITRELNRPSKLLEVCKKADEQWARDYDPDPLALEVV